MTFERAARSRVRRELSTGQTVDLPLALAFAMGGVVVPARRSRLTSVLPAGLSPLPIVPRVGCVALVGIQYRRVGASGPSSGRGDESDPVGPVADVADFDAAGTDDPTQSAGGRIDEPDGPTRPETADGSDEPTGLEPYDEFGVIVPAIRDARTAGFPGSLVGGEVGGYVHWLPVTTDAGVALGRELWGYPKERAAITVTDGPRGLRTVVRDPDDRTELARLRVDRPIRGRERDWQLRSYTTLDGQLIRTRARIRGEIAIGSPLGARVRVNDDLERALGIRPRPLGRLFGSNVRARLFPGQPVDEVPETDG